MEKFFEQIHFPYETLRKGQDEFIKKVYKAIYNNQNILVSAPTGLGKTVSGLTPALYQAKKRGLSVICLTSRQTQSNQIIKTIAQIQKVSNETINCVALIGKRSMCVHKDRDLHPPQDFLEFCRKVRKTNKCGYYLNSQEEDYSEIRRERLSKISQEFSDVEDFIEESAKPFVVDGKQKCGFCPYEMAAEKSFKADVIICDYNYLFQEGMRESFLGRIGKSLNECILIVDEAHNLPDRIRNAHSYSLTTEGLDFALKELKDYIKSSKYDNYITYLKQAYQECYVAKLEKDISEYPIKKEELLNAYLLRCTDVKELDEIIEKLREAELIIREDRLISYVGRVANFLERWRELDEISYLRELEKVEKNNLVSFSMKIRCLDPAEIASSVINNSFSSILMSGTLAPIQMYRDILGIENAQTLELESPFEKDNLLPIHIDDVTTKFILRGPQMYKKYSEHIENILNSTGDRNAIVFFPSYDLLDKIVSNINPLKLNRRVLRETRFMTKEQKENFVREFKKKDPFNQKANVLFAVTSGSFAEGLDLPGDALEMVLVVGLPLAKPDLYTESVIKLYDKKFRKGQFYGYICPAMNKIIQAAGRCIRTERDRGVVVFMDNRFSMALYAQTFPLHWHLKKVKEYKFAIMNFFDS